MGVEADKLHLLEGSFIDTPPPPAKDTPGARGQAVLTPISASAPAPARCRRMRLSVQY